MKTKRYDEAIDHFDQVIEIDKTFIPAYFWKSLVQQFRGDYDASLETYRNARIYSGNDENEPLWLLMQAHAHAANGRRAHSLETLNRYFAGEVNRKHPQNYAVEVALVYHLLGDNEKAIEWLGKFKMKGVKDVNHILEDPRFANLHADARFIALADDWRQRFR